MFSFFKKKVYGDITHMEVVCLHKHSQRFHDMGFADAESLPTHPIINWLADGYAKYQQVCNPPKDIPYYAFHKQFGLKEPHLIACDGERFIEVPGDSNGFVIPWDEDSNEPNAEAIAKVREYFTIKQSAKALMQGII